MIIIAWQFLPAPPPFLPRCFGPTVSSNIYEFIVETIFVYGSMFDTVYESIAKTMVWWFCSKFKHQVRTLINATSAFKPIPPDPLQQLTISIEIYESIAQTIVFDTKILDLYQNLWISCENDGLVILWQIETSGENTYKRNKRLYTITPYTTAAAHNFYQNLWIYCENMVVYRKKLEFYQNLWICCENNGLVFL